MTFAILRTLRGISPARAMDLRAAWPLAGPWYQTDIERKMPILMAALSQ